VNEFGGGQSCARLETNPNPRTSVRPIGRSLGVRYLTVGEVLMIMKRRSVLICLPTLALLKRLCCDRSRPFFGSEAYPDIHTKAADYQDRDLSFLGFCVTRRSLVLDSDELLLTHDPRVVTGVDVIDVARADLGFRAVIVHDVKLALEDIPDVVHLAAVGLYNRLDALGPAPPRLKGVAADGGALQIHELHSCLVGCTRLVWGIEGLRLQRCHLLASLCGLTRQRIRYVRCLVNRVGADKSIALRAEALVGQLVPNGG
jgi:hypothetical protein